MVKGTNGNNTNRLFQYGLLYEKKCMQAIENLKEQRKLKSNMEIMVTCETDYNLSKQTINVYARLDPVYTFKENIVMKIEK